MEHSQCRLLESNAFFSWSRMSMELGDIKWIEEHISYSTPAVITNHWRISSSMMGPHLCYWPAITVNLKLSNASSSTGKSIFKPLASTTRTRDNWLMIRSNWQAPCSSQLAVHTWESYGTLSKRELMSRIKRYRMSMPNIAVWLLFMELSSPISISANGWTELAARRLLTSLSSCQKPRPTVLLYPLTDPPYGRIFFLWWKSYRSLVGDYWLIIHIEMGTFLPFTPGLVLII